MASRLLIVDDSPQFLEAAATLLERQGCDIVAVASNSADATRLARELAPDVVLLDVDLGLEDGFEVADRLVADHGQRVVLISAYGESEIAELIASSSALGFISKSELSARRLAEVVDGSRPSDRNS